MTVTSYSTAPSVSTPYRRWQRVRVCADVKVFGGDSGYVMRQYSDGTVFVWIDGMFASTCFKPHEIAEVSA